MQPSIFNVRVPLPESGDVFLMNTFTDAQLIVSSDVAALLDEAGEPTPEVSGRVLGSDEQAALGELAAHGFLVPDRASEREALERFFTEVREDTSELRLTVLTTLECNFACGYCIQGDHGEFSKHAHRMSLSTADAIVSWAAAKLDALSPERVVVTFFGGEPLLNLPVLYHLAERLHDAATARGVRFLINIITNGLLLTRELVDRLQPLGLNGVKITLDGDRATHDRLRPLRGGQGTFDRIIANIRAVAGRTRISIGGNFDLQTADSFTSLLQFLREQDFADALSKVAFKPVIRPAPPTARRLRGKVETSQRGSGARSGTIALTPVDAKGKPLGGACMTAAGSGTASACDSCGFLDEKMASLREETRRYGFPTLDGVHMGPCEVHRRHAYTIGPKGDLYACPGFAGDDALTIGHIEGPSVHHKAAAQRFEQLAAWRECGDCPFIPVCAGGCAVASHSEQGDLGVRTCHRSSFEAALVTLATDAARA
jgi:uncharacterized protein